MEYIYFENFGDRLHWLRRQTKKTQKEVAAAIGVKPSTYGGYESSVIFPPSDVVCRIANFYGVTTDYLLGRDRYFTERIDMSAWSQEDMEEFLLVRHTMLDAANRRAAQRKKTR